MFALPNPRLRHVPKCKSPRSRTAAFDLLVELVKGAPENYAILHERLLKQHQPGMVHLPRYVFKSDEWCQVVFFTVLSRTLKMYLYI